MSTDTDSRPSKPMILSRVYQYDSCHLCGQKSYTTADVWYPDDAEQRDDLTRYIRICADCAGNIQRVALSSVPPSQISDKPQTPVTEQNNKPKNFVELLDYITKNTKLTFARKYGTGDEEHYEDHDLWVFTSNQNGFLSFKDSEGCKREWPFNRWRGSPDIKSKFFDDRCEFTQDGVTLAFFYTD